MANWWDEYPDAITQTAPPVAVAEPTQQAPVQNDRWWDAYPDVVTEEAVANAELQRREPVVQQPVAQQPVAQQPVAQQPEPHQRQTVPLKSQKQFADDYPVDQSLSPEEIARLHQWNENRTYGDDPRASQSPSPIFDRFRYSSIGQMLEQQEEDRLLDMEFGVDTDKPIPNKTQQGHAALDVIRKRHPAAINARAEELHKIAWEKRNATPKSRATDPDIHDMTAHERQFVEASAKDANMQMWPVEQARSLKYGAEWATQEGVSKVSRETMARDYAKQFPGEKLTGEQYRRYKKAARMHKILDKMLDSTGSRREFFDLLRRVPEEDRPAFMHEAKFRAEARAESDRKSRVPDWVNEVEDPYKREQLKTYYQEGSMPEKGAKQLAASTGEVAQEWMKFVGAVLPGGATEEENVFLEQFKGIGEKELGHYKEDDPWYKKWPMQAIEMTPAMAEMAGAGGMLRGAAKKAGIGKLGQLAAGAAGTTVAMYPQAYNQAYADYRKRGVSKGIARGTAGVTAIAIGALEGIIVNPFTAPAMKNPAVRKGFEKFTQNYIFQYTKNYAGELTEEYLQGLASGYGIAAATWLDNEVPNAGLGQAFDEMMRQGTAAAGPLLFLMGGSGAVAFVSASQKVDEGGTPSRIEAKELGYKPVGKDNELNRRKWFEENRERLKEQYAERLKEQYATEEAPAAPTETPAALTETPVALTETPVAPTETPAEGEKPQPVPEPTAQTEMTYDEFRGEYKRLFDEMAKYSPNEAGAGHFAEKMAELADQHPKWAEQVENEVESEIEAEPEAPGSPVTPPVEQAPSESPEATETQPRAAQEPETAAEPWQMTREEYDKYKANVKPRPHEYLKVADAEVIQNPTDADYRSLSKQERDEYPGSVRGDGTTRYSRDAEGNKWIWRASKGTHSQIEPGLEKIVGRKVNQNLDLEPNHRYLIKQALAEGKPVPPEVLANYPDLQPPVAAQGPESTPQSPKKLGGKKKAEESLGEAESPKTTSRDAHAKLPMWSVYPITIKGKEMFGVKTSEKGGFGDTVHGTKATAQEEAIRSKERHEEGLVRQQKAKADEEQAAKEKQEYEDSFQGFISSDPKTKGRQLKTLGKTLSYKGTVTTRKQLVEDKVALGWTVNSDGQLKSPTGEFLDHRDLTKTGIDYARHISPKLGGKKPAEATKEPWQVTRGEYLEDSFQGVDDAEGMVKNQEKTLENVGLRTLENAGLKRGGNFKKVAQKVVDHYNEKYGLDLYLRLSMPMGWTTDQSPNWEVYGKNILRHRGSKVSDLAEIGLLRHEIEHAFDMARKYINPGNTTSQTKILEGETPLDTVKRVYKGHHENYTAFEYEYLHRQAVKKAIAEGKPVPAEVLAEYPDLQPKKKLGGKKAPEAAKVATKEPWKMTQEEVDQTYKPNIPNPQNGTRAKLNGQQATFMNGSWTFKSNAGPVLRVTDPATVARLNHQASVQSALAEGKPVSAEVLAEYDLAKSGAKPKPEPETAPEPKPIMSSFTKKVQELKARGEKINLFDDDLVKLRNKQDAEVLSQYRDQHNKGSIVLFNEQSDRGVTIMPSTKHRGMYQATWFDANGFSMDSQFKTEEKAIGEVYTDGYRVPDPARGEEIMRSDKFKQGVENLEKVRKEVEKPKPIKPTKPESAVEKAEREKLQTQRRVVREHSQGVRYWSESRKRGIKRKGKKGEVEIFTDEGKKKKRKATILSDNWAIAENIDGKKKTYSLAHIPSGRRTVAYDKAADVKHFMQFAEEIGVDWNTIKDENIPSEVLSRINRAVSAFEQEDLGKLEQAEQDRVLADTEVADPEITADMILDSYDLGEHGGAVRGLTDKGIKTVKSLVKEVPEFAYDPVFVADDKGNLVFRDHHKFTFPASLFNLHPSELKPGQTVGINLPDLGLKRESSQPRVIANVLKNNGFKATVGTGKKNSDTVRVTAGGAVFEVIKDQGKTWKVLGKGAEAATEAELQRIVKGIRWDHHSAQEAKQVAAAEFTAEQVQTKSKPAKPVSPAQEEKETAKPLTKAKENSIDRILDARDRLATGKINRKAFERDMDTILTHAAKLGIEVESVGTYFHADKYRNVADKVTMEIAKQWGSHPTTKRRAARDAATGPQGEGPTKAQEAQQAVEEGRPETHGFGFFGGGRDTSEPVRDDEIPEAIQAPEEQERRLQKARGMRKPSLMRRIWESATHLKNVTRAQEHIPNTGEFGPANEFFRLLRNAVNMAQDEAIRTTAAITDKLGPKQLLLFERFTIMQNLSASVKAGQPLRFGFESADEVNAYLDHLRGLVEQVPAVKEAVETRRKIVEEMTDTLIEYDLLPEGARDNAEAYYHQQVHFYMVAHGMKGGGARAGKVGRSFQRKRVMGKELTDEKMDYNTSYLEAEVSWMTDALAEIEKERLLQQLMDKYDRKAEMKARAKRQNFENVVGGPEIAVRIDQLIGEIRESREQGGSDSDERARRKALIEELESIDPTYPYRVQIAKMAGWFRTENGIDEDYEGGDDNSFWRRVKEEADKGDVPALSFFKALHEREAFIRGTLGNDYATWETLAEEEDGVDIYQPEPGNMFYRAFTIPERVVEQLQGDVINTAELSGDDLRQVLAMAGPRRQFVLPSEVAAQLAETRKGEAAHWLTMVADEAMRSWKVYTLLNPKRAVAYNLRNMTGDIDPVIASDPSLLRHTDRAMRELARYHQGRLHLTDDLRAARNYGVIGSGFVAEEVPDIQDLAVFRRFVEGAKPKLPFKPIKDYMGVVKPVSQWREDTLRYAAFLGYREQLRKGRVKHYGGAKKAVVEQIKRDMGVDAAAAHLARNLLGDYGNISVAGNWIRARLMPFWSFQEINIKRVPRLMVNAYEAGGTWRTAGVLSASAGRAILMSRVAWMYGAMWAWNFFVMGGDEEDELAGYDRAVPHVILGRNADGSIRIFRRVGALGDFLEWFGINEAISMMDKRAAGQVDTSDIIKEMAFAAPEKALNSLRPDLKALYELSTGQSMFPEPFQPRAVRRDEAASHIFGLADEYRTLKGWTLGNGSTARPHYWQRLAVGVVDPRQSALSQTYELRNDFLKKKGKESHGVFPVSRYKEARDAAKYENYGAFVDWKRNYVAEKGEKAKDDFKNWLGTIDPIANRLNDSDEMEFEREFLTSEQRARLTVARNYSYELRDLLITWWDADNRSRDMKKAVTFSAFGKMVTAKPERKKYTSEAKYQNAINKFRTSNAMAAKDIMSMTSTFTEAQQLLVEYYRRPGREGKTEFIKGSRTPQKGYVARGKALAKIYGQPEKAYHDFRKSPKFIEWDIKWFRDQEAIKKPAS